MIHEYLPSTWSRVSHGSFNSAPFPVYQAEFGLIAYISSAHPERAYRVARKLAAGRVLINTVSHDPFAPFGGFKQSGIGREGGIFGLQEYLEPKAIIG